LDDPDAPPEEWPWPFMDDVLALSSSQAAALAQQLNAAPAAPSTTTRPAGSSPQASSGALTVGRRVEGVAGGTDEGAGAIAHLQLAEHAAVGAVGAVGAVRAVGAVSDPGASPSTAAAAEGLLSVVAAAAAAADAAPAQQGGGCGVELVPQLCLLLYDEELQSFGYTASPEMERALNHLAARVGPHLQLGCAAGLFRELKGICLGYIGCMPCVGTYFSCSCGTASPAKLHTPTPPYATHIRPVLCAAECCCGGWRVIRRWRPLLLPRG
jgi:hypothetical protein